MQPALGARPASVLGMVLGSGLRMAAIGAAIGIGIALVLGQAMARFAFGTEPTETWSYPGSSDAVIITLYHRLHSS